MQKMRKNTLKENTEYRVLGRMFRWTVIDTRLGWALLESNLGDETPCLVVRMDTELSTFTTKSGNVLPLIMSDSYETYDDIYTAMDDYDLSILM